MKGKILDPKGPGASGRPLRRRRPAPPERLTGRHPWPRQARAL